jgi:subtilisin family serine protease
MSRPIRIRVSGSRQRYAVLAAGALVATMAVAPATSPATASPSNDVGSSSSTVDTSRAIVQLSAEPLATYSRTKPAQGKKIDFSSATVKSYRALLSKARNDYKAWLRKNVPGATVSGEFDISLNAVSVKLNGASLAQVSATPMVKTAQYEGLYYPTADVAVDPDLALIDATQAWAHAGGSANAGAGVKVAIVDSGIDQDHPCFDDAGYEPQTQLGDKKYTNNKVIVARVFNNKLNQNGFDAEAVGDHGTHVAGTVACNFETPATVNGVAIPYGISGVAPRALLGNYNVFPGTVENARSEDILNALEAAYSDGMDIANMSLGGGSHGIQDLLTVAVDNLDRANMVVSISAGNEGPGAFTIGSPGMAERGLTAGASAVGHFVGAPVTVDGTTYGAASGDFATVDADLTAPLGVALSSGSLSTACSALPAGSLTGTIALISRGGCTFSAKIRNAQDAGATAVLVVNNVAGDPTAMASDGTANQPTVPAYMVGLDTKAALMAAVGHPTTIGAALAYVSTPNSNIMAGFSSQGPVDVSLRVKPDVVAPGVNVLSSIPVKECGGDPCFAFFSGTSMAAPHLAGSAAVVRGQHPDWSAAEVRSAIVNTAVQGVLGNYVSGGPTNNVLVVGAGLENLDNAVQATVGLDPVSVAFGGVPSGSGQTRTETVTVTNLGGSSATYTFAVSDQPSGVSYSVSPATATVAAGASTTVTVTAAAAAGAAPGPKQAFLRVSAGGPEIAHAVLFTWIK